MPQTGQLGTPESQYGNILYGFGGGGGGGGTPNYQTGDMEYFANLPLSTLDGAIDDSQTEITLVDVSLFPAQGYFRIRIEDELMRVTGVDAVLNMFEVERGAESTTAAAHADATEVRHVVTAGALTLFVQGTTPAGAVVGTTDTQTLTNKTIVAANNTITTAASGNLAATELNAALDELQDNIDLITDHGNLTGLTDDDHTQYALLAGRSSGQTIIGGDDDTDKLTLKSYGSTTNGIIEIGNDRVKIGADPTHWFSSTGYTYYGGTSTALVDIKKTGTTNGLIEMSSSAGTGIVRTKLDARGYLSLGTDSALNEPGAYRLHLGHQTNLATGLGYIAARQSNVDPAPDSDRAIQYAKDFAAGDIRWYFATESSSGNPVIIGNNQVQCGRFVSTQTTGTAPFTVSSTTVVTNLNADLLDGQSAPSGTIVGTTDTQTLTNKTLTSPVMGGTITGTYTIGGTPTFPSTVVSTTGSQTLTNKTIVVASNTITTAASGNLTSTNLNAALAELQTDLDTRPQYTTGVVASLPTASTTRTNDFYDATDGLFDYQYNGQQWLPKIDGMLMTDALRSLSGPYYRWTATGAGTNEYACELAAGGNPSLTQPATLFINGAEATSGTAGSLSAGTWGWGNYSGFNTVHVRLSDGTDPDTKAYGYIRSDSLAWLVKGNMSATVTKNHLYIASATNGATLTCRMRCKDVPSTPYTAYAYVYPGACEFANINHMGIGWSDGTKFSSIALRFYNRSLYVTHMSDSTTFSADSGTITVDPEGGKWLAVRDDGTNRYFYVGSIPDYTQMNTVYSIGRTNFLTPTKVGIIDLRNATTGGCWFPHFSTV